MLEMEHKLMRKMQISQFQLGILSCDFNFSSAILLLSSIAANFNPHFRLVKSWSTIVSTVARGAPYTTATDPSVSDPHADLGKIVRTDCKKIRIEPTPVGQWQVPSNYLSRYIVQFNLSSTSYCKGLDFE